MVRDGPNWFLVESIGDKDYLEVFSFYETLKSLTAQKGSYSASFNSARSYSGEKYMYPQGSVELCIRVALYGLGGISNAERFYLVYASIAKECNIPRYNNLKADLLLLI
ncbi:unnamed protein product [Clonostachys solani]|uniref:Uncharacterized protein n=1 Tax=Clonostachys solani TaxID=160281 RepID=A0A9N9ZEK6_9HYPO|nr:unnamed protein product [Clonostachys solani]